MGLPTIADLQATKESIEKNLDDVAEMSAGLKARFGSDVPERRDAPVWVVVEHGTPESDSWELSVCVSGTHGCVSYGWDGDEKHIVWSEGGFCNHTPHPLLIDGYRCMARELAEKLNSVELF